MEYEFITLDDALIGMSKQLLKNGVPRGTRGFQCIEMREPVLIKICDPTSRIIKNPARAWSQTLPIAESIWLLNGVNSMHLPGAITKNLYNFSDDGEFMRAGYGPRIRSFNNSNDDYKIKSPDERLGVDQLRYVVESLIKDPNSRQASITIHDPNKDNFNPDGSLKTTKDTPCTRTIKFEKKNGKLDCIVSMRSNDLLWGFSAVNVFNFTLMQEMVSMLVGIPIGHYYHFAENFHYYKKVEDQIINIATSYFKSEHETFHYKGLNGVNFDFFDCVLTNVYHSALQLVGGTQNRYSSLVCQTTGIDIFDDMLLQIFKFKNKSLNGNEFYNNNLN
jgi:thymidylate synthase